MDTTALPCLLGSEGSSALEAGRRTELLEVLALQLDAADFAEDVRARRLL